VGGRCFAAAAGGDAPRDQVAHALEFAALVEYRARPELPARHDALGDAFSTAQLLLVALAEAKRQGIDAVEGLRAAQRAGRWL